MIWRGRNEEHESPLSPLCNYHLPILDIQLSCQVTEHFYLKLLLGANNFLHSCELVVVVQASRIRQRPASRDRLARDDLLHGQLDFLQVDCCLQKGRVLAKTRAGSNPPPLLGIHVCPVTHRNFGRLEDILRDVSLGEIVPYRLLDLIY